MQTNAEITYEFHARAIRKAMQLANVSKSMVTHLGRKAVSNITGVDDGAKMRAGNWANSAYGMCYADRMPVEYMVAEAGFNAASPV